MMSKIKNIIFHADKFLYKKFGSDKSTKLLENISEAQTIFSKLNEVGKEGQVKFVGGCVRKAVSGENIDDIDLATSLEPDEVKEKLVKENLKIIETGISHGTLTIILNNKSFEITTLRKDVLTDGRHAKVVFTKNWEEDASRRDFTINSIYADIEGRIFDPLNGIKDLQNGKIKFIGNVEERIKEDYLRILRYFRFFNQYSKEKHDENTIRIIKKNINGLNKISKERIFSELKKILSNENLYQLFLDIDSKEIIQNIFPQFLYYKRLKIINNFHKNLKNKYDKYLILASLLLDKSNNYEYFCHKYKTSNNVKDRFKNIFDNYENLKNKKFYQKENIKKQIYLLGKNYVLDLLLFSLSANKTIQINEIEKLINYVNNCKIPKFPISGDYLKRYGYKTGEVLGNKIKILKGKWIENNFNIDDAYVQNFLEKKGKD
jgi:poly(A) polymerase